MADYISVLDQIAKSYRFQHTMNDARQSFEKKIFDRFAIKFVSPEVYERLVPYSGIHPISGNDMNNWSNTLSLDNLNYENMAKQIANYKAYEPRKILTTIPHFPGVISLNTMNPQYIIPSIKVHEYKHILAHDAPFSIAYIYGLKRYDQLKRNGDFDPLDDPYSIWSLSYDINKWMNGSYKPTGWRCFVENNGQEQSRLEKMNTFIRNIDYRLDTLENENNINYVDTPIEGDLLDLYDCMLREMDDLP